MVGRVIGRPLVAAAVLLGVALWAVPGLAQTGQVKGKVVDAKNQPIEGAVVTIEMMEGMNRKYQVKTNRRGEFIQIGLQPGMYKLTATKDGLGDTAERRIGLDMTDVSFTLRPGGAAGEASAEAAKKADERRKAAQSAFSAGVALSSEGKHDEAIAKFTEVLAQIPNCAECYTNIGTNYLRLKDEGKAEEAYKKAIEANPQSPEAYNQLASLYNAQRKFAEAKAMSAEAVKRAGPGPGGGGNADALYNQAVISWNANDFAGAKEQLDAAIKINQAHAESHFLLGRVLINLGKLAEAATEFETYLKLAPTGPNAKEAQSNLDTLKSYRK